ncbi:uPF0246 protein HMPREF0971_01618 [Prevotella sp. CAG:732]|nr:YaaA family protein [Prevotella sp. CAG:732]CDD20815.1 uPF0246 protein HMPREF0971_01618 [Prevotella sp. CAG:732]
MQILLASAKIMNSSSLVEVPLMSEPTYKEQASKFALELSSWDTKHLMKELKCSQAIAQENLQRYQSFWNESEQMPAILAYFGQAYKYLKAETFSKDDFAFAQDHLFISSFLYGILIHLATEEFEHLFDWKRVKEEVKVIQPLFYVDKGDTIKVVSVHAKSCRGAMTRHIIQNRLSHPSDILDFELEGFKYDKDYGDASHPHFIKR